jgi:hypothetical protein
MSAMTQICRCAAPLFSAVLVLLFPGAARPQSESDTVGLRCEVSCSRDKIRTATARIFWIGAEMPLAPQEIRGPAEQITETVETSVYKGGFEKNLFARLDARPDLRPGAEFRAISTQAPALPELDLKVTQFNRPKLSPELRRALEEKDTSGRPTSAAVAAQETSVEVEGLEPGLKYQWRVRFKGPGREFLTGIATCIAPTCPADLKE